MFLYAIALGSNRRSRHGSPAATVRAALDALQPDRASSVHLTPALGPAGRSFANAAAVLTSRSEPPELLAQMKELERSFGRRAGRKWGPRTLDLDILLWSEGPWAESGIVIPHPEMRRRAFVLEPLAEIAPDWRDPLSGATVRQLLFRLARPARG
ncbi:MAG TPA: 2-amino-4-hydroxy-6-hydroxymethyldihydropteridine diphosphokinase [Allosphingosinicella sp.]